MKFTYPPLLAVHNNGFLQHLLFGLISVCVSVKVLYFHRDLEQKSTKQKSCGKSFIVFNCVKSNYEHFIRNYFSLTKVLKLC